MKYLFGIVVFIDVLFVAALVYLLTHFEPMWLPTIIVLIWGIITSPTLKLLVTENKSLFKQ